MGELEAAFHQAEAVALLRESGRDEDADAVAELTPEEFAEAMAETDAEPTEDAQ
jgi:hypothetical protein